MSLASYQLLHSAIFQQTFLSFAGAKVRLFCEIAKRIDEKMRYEAFFAHVCKKKPSFSCMNHTNQLLLHCLMNQKLCHN